MKTLRNETGTNTSRSERNEARMNASKIWRTQTGTVKFVLFASKLSKTVMFKSFKESNPGENMYKMTKKLNLLMSDLEIEQRMIGERNTVLHIKKGTRQERVPYEYGTANS